MKLLLLFSMFGILFFSPLKAQNDTIRDNSYYFDDGISQEKGILKVGAFAIIKGEIPFSYEMPITRSLTIEAGVGLLLPYNIPEWPNRPLFNFDSQERDMGYSLMIHPKYYILQSYPESVYVGLQFHKKEFEQEDELIKYVDTTLLFGYQWIIGEKYTLDIQYGAGYRAAESGASETHLENSTTNTFVIPFNIKLGIIL